MDLSSSGNIAMGGSSKIDSFVGSSDPPNPFAVVYDSDGNIKWGASYDSEYNFVSAIKFNTASDRILVSMDRGSTGLTLVLHRASDGNIQQKYRLREGSDS